MSTKKWLPSVTDKDVLKARGALILAREHA